MNNFENLNNLVLSKIDELNQIVIKQWGEDKVPSFKISYTLNSSNKLGLAHFDRDNNKYKMELNKELLLEFGELYIKEIVSHEYAHFVVDKIYPSGLNRGKIVRSHGKEFKAICSCFGIEGKATTNIFKNSKTLKKTNTTRKWKYACNCNTFLISTRRHNLILKGKKYTCRKCGGELKKI